MAYVCYNEKGNLVVDGYEVVNINPLSSHAVLGEEAITSGTFTLPRKKECKHSGWYRYISFLCFRRKYLICEKCFEIIPQGKWGFFA